MHFGFDLCIAELLECNCNVGSAVDDQYMLALGRSVTIGSSRSQKQVGYMKTILLTMPILTRAIAPSRLFGKVGVKSGGRVWSTASGSVQTTNSTLCCSWIQSRPACLDRGTSFVV